MICFFEVVFVSQKLGPERKGQIIKVHGYLYDSLCAHEATERVKEQPLATGQARLQARIFQFEQILAEPCFAFSPLPPHGPLRGAMCGSTCSSICEAQLAWQTFGDDFSSRPCFFQRARFFHMPSSSRCAAPVFINALVPIIFNLLMTKAGCTLHV